jgi:hypothetical protein
MSNLNLNLNLILFEKYLEIYNNDLSMFKHLVGKSFVSSQIKYFIMNNHSLPEDQLIDKEHIFEITDKIDLPYIHHKHCPVLIIECSNYIIKISYRHNLKLAYIGMIRIEYKKDILIIYLPKFNNNIFKNKNKYRMHLRDHLDCPLSKNDFIKTIVCIENNKYNDPIHRRFWDDQFHDLNKINDLLKSIDDDFPQKYMMLVRYCFNLMGG